MKSKSTCSRKKEEGDDGIVIIEQVTLTFEASGNRWRMLSLALRLMFSNATNFTITTPSAAVFIGKSTLEKMNPTP